MITSEQIDNWLKAPHQLQEISSAALKEFAATYSYFQPIHYLRQLNEQTAVGPFFALRQVFPANPLLLQELAERVKEVPITPADPLLIAASPDSLKQEQQALEQEPVEQVLPWDTPVQPMDYFASQGIGADWDSEDKAPAEVEEKSLLVMMTFGEWLLYMQSKNKKEKEEEADKKALKTMWQKQKLAAAIEEEDEEIPETVFEMAVNSISRNDELVSESLAQVYVKQGKVKQAIEVYRKLSLQNPEKNVYFAAKIENLQKDLEV